MIEWIDQSLVAPLALPPLGVLEQSHLNILPDQ